jgi:hypothetical protein
MRAEKIVTAGVLKRGLAALAALAAPATLCAQACPLCYQSAASSPAQLIAALKNGIFALMIPSLAIGAGVAFVTYRKRNACDEDEVSAGE